MAVSAPATPLHWVYEAVESDRTAGGHAAALDAQDYAHIVYGRSALYYDWEDADGWHSEIADASSAPDSMSMALDAAGRPHAVYVDRLTLHVKYARRDSRGWSVETIAEDAYGSPGWGTLAAFCLDPAGWPHVGYSSGDYEALQLKYLGKDASGWHAATVGSWSQVILRPGTLTIRVAGDGQPHLACRVQWPGIVYSVFHAWRRPTGWQSANVSEMEGNPQFDAAGRVHVAFENSNARAVYVLINGAASSVEELPVRLERVIQLVVSASGVPHVILETFDYPNPNTLQHWTKVGGAWQQSILESNLISDAALSLDASGRPYVLYTARVGSWPNPITHFTRTAWQDAGGWHTEEDPSRPRYDSRGSLHLMLTQDRQPRVAYSYSLFGAPGTVFYWHEDAGWQERVLADPGNRHVTQIRLALDDEGNPHVAYNGPEDVGFRYAWRDREGWHITLLEDAFPWGGFRQVDLALDGDGRTHIVYKNGLDSLTSRGWLYVVRNGAEWDRTVVGANPASEVALALDTAGQPHVLSCETSTGAEALVHYRHDGSGWQLQNVAEVKDADWPAIAVDPMGGLHICYRDANDALRYGYRNAQGWQLTTVDANGANVGAYNSLDLDEQGQPHIAYAAQDPDQLRYAWKDAGGWHTRTVDSGGDRDFENAHISLCLAPDGTPHITYRNNRYGAGEEIFRYAWLGAGGWEWIDLERGGATSSLVIGSHGRPHIAYCNWIGRESLTYLYVPPFALTGLTPLPGGRVRLGWQGALEGVGVDGAAALDGEWSPVANNLSGLAGEVEANPTLRFFRLRQAQSP